MEIEILILGWFEVIGICNLQKLKLQLYNHHAFNRLQSFK